MWEKISRWGKYTGGDDKTMTMYLPVFLCVVMYALLLGWFIYKGDYAYAWYWFSAMQITVASVLMAAR
jgi:hypothetical protein